MMTAESQIPKNTRARAALLALLCLSFGLRPSAFGISVAPATPATPGASSPLPNEAAVLSKIVGRLASRENRSARDWAELGRETATWGSRLQSQQQPVPEGPVRDALAAVDLGAKLDKAAADWPKLREELEALLKKPEDEKEKEQQQQQNPQDKNEQQQNQDQQKQDQKKSDQQQKQQNESQKENEQDQNQQQQQSDEQQPQKQEKKPQGESAFGDMTKKDQPPPPPPQNTQKVGGAPEKKEEQKEPLDPALALPMQKLEQLKNQDSPAQLFQLMEGERKQAKKTGKDW